MRRVFKDTTIPFRTPLMVALCAIATFGCVSTDTHTKALTELEAAKKLSAQQAAELETLKKKSQAQADQMQQQLASLQQNFDQEASQRKTAEQQAASLAKERAALEARSGEFQSKLDSLEQEKGRMAKDQEQLRQEQSQLTANLEQERQRLKAEEAEKARLERERAAKEEEIRRLTRTQEELTKSLQDEIAKGNITIQQVRDRLTINMVDRVLFDSGKAQIKPAGMKVLKQVADVLNKVTDKQIRIEGHTDNVPISTKLQDRFKTNWELSTARATTVVRYLIDQGGVDRQYLSAVGYADTRPIASNDAEEGRTSNRRIEIVLYPRDLKEIAGELKAQSN
jgi:chemotaxis protein MotB